MRERRERERPWQSKSTRDKGERRWKRFGDMLQYMTSSASATSCYAKLLDFALQARSDLCAVIETEEQQPERQEQDEP